MDTGENNTNGQQQTPAPAPQGGTPPPDNSTLMGVLAYIGILVIIPYLVARENPFVKFHVKQGIVLAVIEICVWVLGMTMPLLFPILALVNLGTLVLSIIGIVNVLQKKQEEIPLVGKFAVHVNI